MATTPSRTRGLLIALLFGFPLLVRGAYALEVAGAPWLQWNLVVAWVNDDFARDLARHPAGPWTLFRSPWYPWLLSLVYRAGGEAMTMRILQWILGAAGCLLVHGIARRLAGPRAALAAWLIASLYGPALFYEGELLEVACAGFFVLCGLAALAGMAGSEERTSGAGGGLPRLPPAARALIGGVALGGAALMRPEQGAALPFVAGALALFPGPPRIRARRVALFAAGATAMLVLLILPGLVIPVEVNHARINAAIAFYLGNHETADGQQSIFPNAPERPTDDPEARAGHMTGLDLTGIEVARAATGRGLESVAPWWLARGRAAIAAHPGGWLALEVRKSLLFWNGFLLTTQKDPYVARDFSTLLWWLIWSGPLLLPVGLVLPLAAAGAAAHRGPLAALLLAVPAGCWASTLAFTHDARFQHTAMLSLLPLAGAGVMALAGALRARQWRLPAIAAMVVVVCHLDPFGTHRVPVAPEYFRIGVMHRDKGETEEAARAFLVSIGHDPAFVPSLDSLVEVCAAPGACAEEIAALRRLHDQGKGGFDLTRTLAEMIAQAGRTAEAAALAREMVARDPRRPDGYRLAARVAAAGGDAAGAVALLREGVRLLPGDAGLRLDLARALLSRGEAEGALAQARAALAGAQGDPGAAVTAGMALLTLGRADEAAVLLEDARALHPGSIEILGTLAQAREAQGRPGEAESAYREVLAREARHPEALYRLALLLRSQGRMAESRAAALEARAAGHPQADALLREIDANRPPSPRVQRGREEPR